MCWSYFVHEECIAFWVCFEKDKKKILQVDEYEVNYNRKFNAFIIFSSSLDLVYKWTSVVLLNLTKMLYPNKK